MKMENQTSKIKPAERLASVSEYYFSKKLKEVAQMNAEGKDVISLGIGSLTCHPLKRPSKRSAKPPATRMDTATCPTWASPNCAKPLPGGTRSGTA